VLVERVWTGTLVRERDAVAFQRRRARARLRGPRDQSVDRGAGVDIGRDGAPVVQGKVDQFDGELADSLASCVNESPSPGWRAHDCAPVVCALLRFRKIFGKFFLDSRQRVRLRISTNLDGTR